MSAVPGAAAAVPAAGRGLLRALASLRLTFAGLILLAAGALAAGYTDMPAAWPLAAPLLLLGANLAAAIAVNPALRQQKPLLAFHLALLALVVIAAAGRLTYLKGRLELSTGETFAGELTKAESGPLHAGPLGRIAFTNESFSIAYSPGRNRDETRNTVTWTENGQAREAVIGDQHPLVLGGYRFYPTGNKGFAPMLAWQAPDGSVHRGTVHMPSFPLHEDTQTQDWTPPLAARPLWMMLELGEKLIDPAQHTEFRLPSAHRLVVRAGDLRAELAPGERVAVAGGVLTYEGLTTWMGYEVYHDATLPWLLAAALAAVAALAWHFARKFARERWDD